MTTNRQCFVKDYQVSKKFKTNNNQRSKEYLEKYKGAIEIYLNVVDLFDFLSEVSNNDEYQFIYKFTYDFFFKQGKLSHHLQETLVYIEHNIEREKTSTKIRNEVLEESNGKCFFGCGYKPFETTSGEYYLEIHHCIPLSYAKKIETKGDVKANLIAICPLCHRRVHFECLSSDIKQMYIEQMYEHIKNISKSYNINNLDSYKRIYTVTNVKGNLED